MNTIRSRSVSSALIHAPVLLFLVFWLLGLMLGTYFAVCADNTYFSMMRGATSQSVSIFGLAAAIFLPFLIAAYADHISSKWLLYSIAALKAFSFSACSACLSGSFGSAAWLVGTLLQFSDRLTLPVFVWFCIRRAGQKDHLLRDLSISLVWCVAACFADYFVISPFLAGLIGN